MQTLVYIIPNGRRLTSVAYSRNHTRIHLMSLTVYQIEKSAVPRGTADFVLAERLTKG